MCVYIQKPQHKSSSKYVLPKRRPALALLSPTGEATLSKGPQRRPRHLPWPLGERIPTHQSPTALPRALQETGEQLNPRANFKWKHLELKEMEADAPGHSRPRALPSAFPFLVSHYTQLTGSKPECTLTGSHPEREYDILPPPACRQENKNRNTFRTELPLQFNNTSSWYVCPKQLERGTHRNEYLCTQELVASRGS